MMKRLSVMTVSVGLLFGAAAWAQDDVAAEPPEKEYSDPEMTPPPAPEMDTSESQQNEWEEAPPQEPGTGGSEDVTVTPPPSEPSEQPQTVVIQNDTQEKKKRMMTDRVRVGVGGGVEGFTGVLNNRVNAGPTWGVTVGSQPLSWIGAEIAYSGAVNEVNGNIATAPDHLTNGADIVRNGGHVAVTLSAPTPYVQPYALAGVGYDYYNVRGDPQALFQDDAAGRVPLGGGVRARVGPFSTDLRLQYNAFFDQDFAQLIPAAAEGGGYTGMLTLGTRF